MSMGVGFASSAASAAALLFVCAASASEVSHENPTLPSLRLVEQTLLTTAKLDFNGNDRAFQAATRWTGERLQASSRSDQRAPHLACAEDGNGREAASRLGALLSPESVRPVSHSSEHGVCFMVTASQAQVNALMSWERAGLELASVGPFPSALKMTPGLLDHGRSSSSNSSSSDGSGSSSGSVSHAETSDETGRLFTSHGSLMSMDNVQGLAVELSPGTLPARSSEANVFIGDLLEGLMSEAVDLHASNFWSDPSMSEGEHLAKPEGALRGREWSRAATVVHELSFMAETTPGDVCSWGNIDMHHASDDVLLVSGLDHLLHDGRGVGGQGEEATELSVACFMGLVSFLAGRHEVLRIAPWHMKSVLNAAARANIQSASVTKTPLTDAGLDGSGEVIQIVDSGLNETSCFFADGDGKEVEHGYYFEELGSTNPYFSYSSDSFSKFYGVYDGGNFVHDSGRRKVIQYINLVKPGVSDGEFATSGDGARFPLVSGADFNQDDAIGHGTHTAGSAAGATLHDPATTVDCTGTKMLGCGGGCFSDEADDTSYSLSDLDDVVDDDFTMNDTPPLSINKLCPMFGCEGGNDDQCLSDDVGETLAAHGGMAQGAKLSIFDMFFGDYSYADLAGNGVWESCMDAGCKLHSNSYGVDSRCELSALDLMYDDFMYKNPENLLIFAGGNEGEFTDRTVCTANSPAIAKNVLAIGASSSGQTRLTNTDYRGRAADGTDPLADIDTVAVFSSYGPTQDGRIKPEVLAPGDEIYSATDDETDKASCQIKTHAGTSMSCAVAAGAAAMVRQYFVDPDFYARDVKARGFCDDGFLCDAFSPSAATVKAMLINSANLMGGSTNPDNYRGFGRIHLEAGMPLKGNGETALFVADSGNTEIKEKSKIQYLFDVDASADLDFRATLSWIDPAASTLSAVQLVNDLDLRVVSPGGTKFTMWTSGDRDSVNVNERVAISASNVTESGTWAVRVRSRAFSTESQSFSLVVSGAISPATGAPPKIKQESSADFNGTSTGVEAEPEDGVEEAEDSGAAVSAPGVAGTLTHLLLAAAATFAAVLVV